MGDYKKLIFTFIDQIWRRRWTAMLMAWSICMVGWFSIAMLPDKYTSQARVYVDTQSLLNPLLKGISVRSDDPRREQEVAVMQRTLTSRPNLMKVAQLTDLDKSANSTAELQALIDKLQNRIEVSNQGNNLFQVSFTDNSPSMAKRVVQALLTIFVENNVGDRRADMQTARSFIEVQLAEYETKLSEAEQKLAAFKVANVDYLSAANENFSTRLQNARGIIKERGREVDDLMEQRGQLKQQLDATPQFLSIDAAPQVVVGGGGGSPMQQRIRALQSRIDELRLQYTDKHPEIVRSLEAMKELQAEEAKSYETPQDGKGPPRSGRERSEVTNEVYNQLAIRLSELDGKIASAKHRLDDAEKELTDLQKQSVEGPRIEAEFTALTRDYQVLKSSYEGLLVRRESARIGEAADSSADSVQFRIIAEPEEPALPAGPMRRVFNFVVLIIGVAGGGGFVILLARLEDCVTVPEDLAQFIDHAVLGCISSAVTLTSLQPFFTRHRKFLMASGGLAAMALIFVASAPNFSTIPSAIATRLSSL